MQTTSWCARDLGHHSLLFGAHQQEKKEAIDEANASSSEPWKSDG